MHFAHKNRSIPVIAFIVFGCISLLMMCQKQETEYFSDLRSNIFETDEYIEATGIGASSTSFGRSEARIKQDAELKANFQAYELLAESLMGVRISGNIAIRDLNINEGQLSQLVKVRLEGVRREGETKFERQEDGSWLAAYTVRYPKKRIENLVYSIKNDSSSKEIISQGILKKDVSYTGIVIDLRSFTGFPSLLSTFFASNTGEVLFSIRDIDPAIALKNGGYLVFSTISDAVLANNGPGEYPLIIIPGRYDSDLSLLYLSGKDSRKFQSLSNKDELIENGKIVLII